MTRRRSFVGLQYWQTVRHLSARQIAARLALRAAARARGSWPAVTSRLYDGRVARSELRWRHELLGPRRSSEALRECLDPVEREEVDRRVAAIVGGQFEFLNDRGDLGWPPNWAAPSKPQLWRFHLHYCDGLIDLALAAERRLPLVLELIEHWIAANPIHGAGATSDAWHPYVVSLRMVNWMLALSATGGPAEVSERVQHKLLEHALFLERNLEIDVGGNHLLKNLKAMIFAGCFWDGERADRWRRRFGAWFTRELRRQLLADGGHCERSPMYHSEVLCDTIEVAALLLPRDPAAVAELLPLVFAMERFLSEVTHPDGEIALFNDSVFGIAPSPEALARGVARLAGGDMGPTVPRLELLFGRRGGPAINQSTPERSTGEAPFAEIQRASASGYVAVPGGRRDRYLLADVGAVCPDDLPAHAHADLLSFELSLDGRRMIVDSGVGQYAAGPWRDYYRSTRAHNTVMVDGCEQSDCWASFRVGRRAVPVNVSFQRDAHQCVLAAEHTGYDHLAAGVRHRRKLVWSNDGYWIIDDTLVGRGLHTWTSFCHFHPDAEIIGEGASWIRVARGHVVLDVCWYGFVTAQCVRGRPEEFQGWYADRFGPPVPATVLVLAGSGRTPVRFGYALIPQASREAVPPPVWTTANVGGTGVGTSDRRIGLTL